MKKTTETLKQRNTPFTWFILVVAFLFFVPSLLMDSIWFHLKSVEVSSPVDSSQMIELAVDREIHRPFRGSYLVTIREINGSTQEAICEGKPLQPFPYDPARDLPEPLSLTWWLGSDAYMQTCKENGFTAGKQFQIRTCHTVVATVWDLPLARRCVMSNVFTLT